MIKQRKAKRIRSSFTFGGLIGEHDPLLNSAYYDNGDFEVIESFLDRRFFVIGRTGSGKSASFRHLKERHPSRVLQINPEDLSMRYLTNNHTVQMLLALDVKLEPFFRALWKHVIVIEVINYRYRPLSTPQRLNALAQLKDRFDKDPAKKRSKQYLEKYEESFWCDTAERIQDEVRRLENSVTASGEVKAHLGPLQVGLNLDRVQSMSSEARLELRRRLQPIVDQAQIVHLNDMIRDIHEYLLESEEWATYLVVDDLDKEWVDEELANTLIRCLFDAVLDIQSISRLKVIVALRTNIFRQLGYGDKTRGGQEEKFRASALELQWTRSDLKELMEQRAEAAAAAAGTSTWSSLGNLLPRNHPHRGSPLDYMLDRTLLRPRDAIAFMNCALREASGKERVGWEHIFDAEVKYSEDRLMALRDEWKNPYDGIDRVFEVFRAKPAALSRNELTDIFGQISALPGRYPQMANAWLDQLLSGFFDERATAPSWFDLYGPLLSLLYDISFLGVGVEFGAIPVFAHDESTQPRLSEVNDEWMFHVHPAYRRHLELTTTGDPDRQRARGNRGRTVSSSIAGGRY